MKLQVVKVEERGREYKQLVEKLMDDVAERGADIVLADTKRLVPKRTGQLASEIEVKKGKFKSGDYFIEAQGPGNYSRYYASFVEMGSTIFPYGNKDAAPVHLPARPYLRPALKKNRKRIAQMAQAALD